MSFFNKIIDKAKFVSKEDKQQQIAEPTKETNKSFFAIHTPHSSTSSSNPILDNPQQQQKQQQQKQQQQQQQHLQKVQDSPTPATNLYASGYVTPRQSQDLHQNMDVDSSGKNPTKFD